MSATKSDIVASSSSPNTNDPTERLNNFYLRLQVLSQNLNDGLVCITRQHDANKAQFDSVTTSLSNLNSMCGQMTQRQSALEQQTHAINQKMDLLLKHFGKHEIGAYVDEIVRTHVGSPHVRGSSPSEFTNDLHDNLGKMNLGSNSIAQPHTRLSATGDLQFNLGDLFQPANVNFLLDYQPPRQNYPPNQVREDVVPQRYQPKVIGNCGRDQDRQVRQPQRAITKKVKISTPEFDSRMNPNAFSD